MAQSYLREPVPGYLSVPGASGDSATTPDHADFAITGDIDIRVCVALNDWTTSVVGGEGVVSQGAGSDRGWALSVSQTTGLLRLDWTTTGSSGSGRSGTSSVAPTVADGAPLWVRATLDVDNGASGCDVKFYTSTDSVSTAPASVTWTQLGATQTSGPATSIFNSTSAVAIGGAGAYSSMQGKAYYAEVRSSIAGTVVADPDFRDLHQRTSPTLLTDTSGKVWTVAGAASWVSPANTDRFLQEDGSLLLLDDDDADNLVPNPSFEVSTTQWSVSAGALSRVTSGSNIVSGTAAMRWTSTTSTTQKVVLLGTPYPRVTPSATYTLSVYALGSVSTLKLQLYVDWYTSDGSGFISTSSSADVFLGTATTRYTLTAAAPGSAFYADPGIGLTNTAGTNALTVDMDAVMLNSGSLALAYFDGSTTPASPYTFTWDGPSDASSSSRVSYAPLRLPRVALTPARPAVARSSTR